MRDIAFALVLSALVLVSLRRPWIGVMAWVWVSLMTPQLMMYGFMSSQPVSMVTGVATLIGIVFTKDPRRMPFALPIVLLVCFSLWMVVTCFFSLVPTDENWAQLDKVLKINFFTLVTIFVIHTRKQVDVLIAVVALSVAYFGIKGGIFTITTGGGFRVRGEGGFIAGNNEIGLGLIMTIPLMYYLLLITSNKWIKRALWAALGLTVVAALGTQSRGALVGVAGMTAAFVLRSPRPGRLILPILIIGIFVLVFMPESWWARMESIGDYEKDESAMGRLNAWILAFNVAKDNFFGGGFTLETPDIFHRYAPNPEFIAVAHSIYFQVLGQHGFVGLALYLVFWALVFSNCRWLAKNARDASDLNLARMIEISLIGFATGGAFLNLAYFDGPYYLMAALMIVRYKLYSDQSTASQPSQAGSRSSAGDGKTRVTS